MLSVLVRKEAVIIRVRLCMKPSVASWRMAASTTGMPVCPARHASSVPSPVDHDRGADPGALR
jgi:hypothetical protein